MGLHVPLDEEAPAFSSDTTPYTAPTEPPAVAPVSRMDVRFSRRARMTVRLLSSITRGRPPSLPRFRAASSPFFDLRTIS